MSNNTVTAMPSSQLQPVPPQPGKPISTPPAPTTKPKAAPTTVKTKSAAQKAPTAPKKPPVSSKIPTESGSKASSTDAQSSGLPIAAPPPSPEAPVPNLGESVSATTQSEKIQVQALADHPVESDSNREGRAELSEPTNPSDKNPPSESTEALTLDQRCPNPNPCMVQVPDGIQLISIKEVKIVPGCDPRLDRPDEIPQVFRDINPEDIVLTLCWNPQDPELHMGIVDGHYLFQLAKEREDQAIQARFLPISNSDELFKEAVGRNAKHGIQLTLREKKAAAKRLKNYFNRQEDLGEHLGVSQETISRWRKQDRKLPAGNLETPSPEGTPAPRGRKKSWEAPLNRGIKVVEESIQVACTPESLQSILQKLAELRNRVQEKLDNINLQPETPENDQDSSITEELGEEADPALADTERALEASS